MHITQKNFVIPIQDDLGNELKIWIPHPHDVEMSQISRVLAYINKECQSMPIQSIILDYERLIEEACIGFNNTYSESLMQKLNVFYARAEAGACLDDGRDFSELSEAEKHAFRGALLFTSALWRYTYKENLPQGAKQEVKDLMNALSAFFTSQNAQEWRESLLNAFAESQATDAEPTQEAIKVSPMQ